MKEYLGNTQQVYGVEAYALKGGKADGMNMLHVRSGGGMEFTVSADRCADITRLAYKGNNFGLFTPVGHVAPEYYDRNGGFPRSFTGGMLTTCGLANAGSACEDEGKFFPQHGDIHATPAENIYWDCDDKNIIIKAKIREACFFGMNLVLNRTISCEVGGRTIKINDTVVNEGHSRVPLMLLYHFNVGYPLLSENAELFVNSAEVCARDDEAQKGIGTYSQIIKPINGYKEQCFYHKMRPDAYAAIFNGDIDCGLKISFDTSTLNYFTQWKMMGEREYALGLEPANCHVQGRKKMREDGALAYISPDESVSFSTELEMLDCRKSFEELLR